MGLSGDFALDTPEGSGDFGHGEHRGRVAARLGYQHLLRGHLDDGDLWLAEALERLDPAVDPLWVARTVANQGELARLRGDLGLARVSFQRAFVELSAAGPPAEAALALGRLAALHHDAGELDVAADLLGRAVDLADGVGGGTASAHLRLELGFAEAERGELGRALEALLRAASDSRRHARPRWEASARLLLGTAQTEARQHRDARISLRRGLDLARDGGLIHVCAVGLAVVAVSRRLRDKHDSVGEAVEASRTCLRRSERKERGEHEEGLSMTRDLLDEFEVIPPRDLHHERAVELLGGLRRALRLLHRRPLLLKPG